MLSASACRFDLTLDLALNRNGSGTAEVTAVTDQEFERTHQLLGSSFAEFLGQRGDEVGIQFESSTVNGTTTYLGRTAKPSAEAMEAVIEGLAPGIGDVRIVRDDNELQVTTETRALPTIDDLRPLFEGFNPEQFEDDVSVTVSLDMPGDVFTENADEIVEGTLIWHIPFSERRVIIRADGDAREDRFPWWLAGVAFALAGGIFFLLAIRSTSDEIERVTDDPLRRAAGQEREKVQVPEGFGER